MQITAQGSDYQSKMADALVYSEPTSSHDLNASSKQMNYQWTKNRDNGEPTILANEQNHIRYGAQHKKTGRRNGQKDKTAPQQHASNMYNH